MCIIIPPSLEEKNQGPERLSDLLKVIQLVDPWLEHGFAGLLGPCSSLPITLHRAVLDVPLRQCQTPACVNCGVALLCPLQSCGRRSAMGRYIPKHWEFPLTQGQLLNDRDSSWFINAPDAPPSNESILRCVLHLAVDMGLSPGCP